MKNNFITKIIGATLAFAMMIGGAVGINASKEAKEVNADTQTGTINFGSGSGRTKIDAASVTGDDSLDNEWTITTAGTTSFTTNNGWTYSQIGSGSKPASSITFTTSLDEAQTITSFSAKFGGFNGTAGTVTLKVGDTSVGSGSLDGSSDVTITNTVSNASSTNLSVTVTGIAKGVKAYFVSYSYESGAVITYHQVSFETFSDDSIDAMQVADNGTISSLPTPTKAKDSNSQTKYVFEGWYTDNSFDEQYRFTSQTRVTSDLTLYAHYTEVHYNIVHFHTNGGTAVEDQEVNNGQKATQPNSTKDGCMLEGWYKEEGFVNRFNFNNTITDEDLDLYAKWTSIIIEDNGLFVKVENTAEIVSGGKYLITYNDQVAFNGFLSNLDVASNTIPVTFSGDYIVKDSNTCKAYFVIDTENNTIKSSSGYYIGKTANSNGLNTSTTEAYQNAMSIDGDGHFVVTTSAGPSLRYNKASGDTRFRYYKTGQESIDLYKFTRTYTVSFETNSESNIDDVIVLAGETLTLPNNPTKAADASYSYTFEGWYTDSNLSTPFVQSNPINSDLTLYAKYAQEAINNPSIYLNTIASNTTLLATESSNIGEGEDSVTVADLGLEDTALVDSFEIGGVTFTSNGGIKYYENGANLRVYKTNSFTISCARNISGITFAYTSGYDGQLTASTGSLVSGVWSGEATSITFTNNTQEQIRITGITVDYLKQTVSVTSAGLRFSASVAKSTWAAIEENWDISEYGFMLFKTDSLDGLSETPVKDRYENSGALAVAHSASGAAPTYEEGDNYVFSVKVNVSTYSKYFCAAAYFVIDDVYYFLTEQQKTVKGMAEYHIANGGTTISSAALAILAA